MTVEIENQIDTLPFTSSFDAFRIASFARECLRRSCRALILSLLTALPCFWENNLERELNQSAFFLVVKILPIKALLKLQALTDS